MPPSVPIPQTPGRQLSTIVNSVSRSAKQADKKFLASHILFGLGKRPREVDTGPTVLNEPQAKRHAQQATSQVGAGVSSLASYTDGQANQTVQKTNVPREITPIGAIAASSMPQPQPINDVPSTTLQETREVSPISSRDQQQLVNVTLPVSRDSISGSTEISKAFSEKTPLSVQDVSIVQTALLGDLNMLAPVVESDLQQEIISDDRSVASGSSVPQPAAAASIPLATPSAIVQTSILPSPVPLTVPVEISPVLSLEVNENTTQPIAACTPKQPPQPNTQHSFIGVPSSLASQKQQPLFLPSPVSSPGVDGNDDSIFGAQLANVDSQSFNLHKSSSSAKRKNRAYVLAPPRPKYVTKHLKYLQLEKRMSHASRKRIRMTSGSSVSTPVTGEEGV